MNIDDRAPCLIQHNLLSKYSVSDILLEQRAEGKDINLLARLGNPQANKRIDGKVKSTYYSKLTELRFNILREQDTHDVEPKRGKMKNRRP